MVLDTPRTQKDFAQKSSCFLKSILHGKRPAHFEILRVYSKGTATASRLINLDGISKRRPPSRSYCGEGGVAGRDVAELGTRTRLAAVVVSNAAIIVTALGATFAFAGFTYYEQLFDNFGLKPFAIELSNVDIAAHGAYAVTWAIWELIREYWLFFTTTIVAAFTIGAVIAFGTKSWPKLRRLLHRSRPILEQVGEVNNRILWLMVALLVLGIGFTAGSVAAKRDFAYFEQARKRATNCYKIKGTVIRGVPLAQDKDTIILVRRASTILLPFDEIEVAACQLKFR